MSKRFNVGIDVDGVLSNFTKGARTLCKELLNGRPSDDLIQTTWAFGSLGITPEEERLMWKKLDTIPNWWTTLEPLKGTDFLAPLFYTHRCIFITNRKDGAGDPIEVQTQLWLIKHFNLENPNVLISGKKGPVADGLKLDFYIDDRPENVNEVQVGAPNCKTYMCRWWPGNLKFQAGYPLSVSNFNEFAATILRENSYCPVFEKLQ